MNNKKLGTILFVIGIVLAVTMYAVKAKEDAIIEKIISEKGSCFLEDGTCLHRDRNTIGYTLGGIFSAAIIALGAYLIFFEKSQKAILSTLEKQKQIKVKEERFDILLKGLSKEEQKVLKAVKSQEGISQSTLRLRTDMHKSKLSIVLKELEKKELIIRKKKGKTKKVFLKINI